MNLVLRSIIAGIASALLVLGFLPFSASPHAPAGDAAFAATLTPKGPTFIDASATVRIPSDQGIRYFIDVDGEPVTSEGVDYAIPGDYSIAHGIEREVPITVTARPAGSADELTGTTEWTHEFPPPVVRTPKGPTFRDDNFSVYIPSDQGIRYYIDVDGTNITKGNLPYAKPGTYTEADGIERGVPITVTARLVNDNEVLDGTTEWTHTFAAPTVRTPKGPTFRDDNFSVYIPSDYGIRYHIDVDGEPVTSDGLDYAAPGTYTADHGIKRGVPITVTARLVNDNEVLDGTTEWTHEFEPAETLTPKGPTFDEWDATVYIPSDHGIRYYIDVDGTNVTKDDLPYARPGLYGAAEGIRAGVPITVRAEPVSSSAELDGTTEWPFEFHVRPDYSLQSGDEFDDDVPIPASGWTVYNTRASSLSDVARTVYTKDAIRVRDGNLEIRTARHCLTGDEEPTAENESPNGAVCAEGTRTVYSSGRMNTDFIFDAPFEMEVRARMSDGMIDGMHFAAWMRNDQPYCTTPGVESSRMSEIDTMEVLSSRARTTNTTHVTCVKRENATGTRRDGHSMPGQIAGAWNTYRMTWDGYAVRYYFNDQLVPSDRGHTPETTGETLGMDQDDFRSAMNDHPYQVIIDSIVFADTVTWVPPANHDEPFPARVDRVDYLRMKPLEDVHPSGAIGRVWANSEDLGAPTGPEQDAGPAGSRMQTFENGTVYWSPSTGAHAVTGAIGRKYGELGGPESPLGLPTSDERALRDGGASQSFQGGQIHWSAATGAHATRGAMLNHWRSQGWENGPLGYPTSDETTVDGIAVQTFQGGTLYWSSSTGVRAVTGAIGRKYGELGGPESPLGLPTSDERALRDGGASQSFQGGQIHWSRATGAHATRGAMLNHWRSQGWENGALGYPTSDETTIDGTAVQTFQGGTLYWRSGTGVLTVRDAIGRRHAQNGGLGGWLGAPVRNEGRLRDGGASQAFDGGQIHWSRATGAHATRGAIQRHWRSQGWETGWLGYPTSEETPTAGGGVEQTFEGGKLSWAPGSGVTVERY